MSASVILAALVGFLSGAGLATYACVKAAGRAIVPVLDEWERSKREQVGAQS